MATVLALGMVVFGSGIAASASEVTLSTDNMNRGSQTAIDNGDGTVTTKGYNISFYLPETVYAGETVTVHVAGTSVGDFRMWLIDSNETTVSEQYSMSANGFTSGDFDVTTTFTATSDATEFFFKAPTWDGIIDELTVKSLNITKGTVADISSDKKTNDTSATTTDTAANAPAKTTTTTTKAPKTGEASNTTLYLVLTAVASLGFIVVSRKKTVAE